MKSLHKKSGHPCEPCLHPVVGYIRPAIFSQKPLSVRGNKRNCEEQFTKSRPTKDLLSAVRYLLRSIQRHKQEKKKNPTITIFHINQLFLEQKGKCYLTGRKLTAPNLSFDRLDNSIGYHPGNIKLCVREANLAKHVSNLTDFISLCEDVVRNNIKVKRPNE